MTTYRCGRDLLAAGLILAALTGCGGGGGGNSPPPVSPSPPAPVPPPPPPPPPPAGVPAPGAGVTSGDTLGVTSTGRLVTFDRAAPALDTAIAITGLQANETVVGLDIRAGGTTPGELYALGSTGRLYTVNTTTGVATLKATLAADASDTTDAFTALSGTEFGVDFNPVADRLRVVSDTGQNLRIDADSGATITDSPLASGGSTRSGVSGAAYTNAFSAACRTSLYYIDATTDQLLTTADANGGAVTVVGPLGVDTTAVGDFEVATAADGTNSGYAVLVVGGVPTSYQIDLATGTAATTGAVTLLDANEVVRDTTIAPPATSPTQLAGDVFGLTESNKLVSFNSSAPQKVCTSVAFTGQQSAENIVGIDVRPLDTMLYALGSGGHLYTVDTATGALTLKSTLSASLSDNTDLYAGLVGTEFGIDFNPGIDSLRVVSDTGQNLRVAADNGTTITDVAVNPVGPTLGAAAYGNNFVGTNASLYYTIDSTGDSLQVLGRPSGTPINGDLMAVGALGVDVSSVGGFDIFGTNNWGLAALSVGGAATSDLFNVNLLTGAATSVGTVGGGERLRGLAYGRLPVATVFALTTDNHLVSFKPLTPGTFDTDVAISGLQGAEVLVALDFRPSNGSLYGVTDAGRVYTIDTATGAASGGVALAANALDTTAPFTALAGTHFDADFSPVDNVLRVQSDTGQNLRVDVDAGTVITDGALTPGAPQVVGIAFTNNYAGAASSNPYVLDVASGALLQYASISGALTMVGSLNAGPFATEGGFDIVGGANGLLLAALRPTGATQSTLYRVNLSSGMLTSIGLLGSSSTTVIKTIAVRLQ